MGKIENFTIVKTYEESKQEQIKVQSHWNRENLIVLTVGENQVTIVGEDLKRAIDNCMNVGF